MVVLGKDPAVKVGRDVVADVHLCEVLIVLHLVVWKLDPLLEGDRVGVLASIDGLGNTRVGAVGSDDHVDLKSGRGALPGGLVGVVRIHDLVLAPVALWDLNVSHEPVDGHRTALDGAIAEEAIQNLSPRHADVLVGLQSLANVGRPVGRRDHLHPPHPSVDDLRGEFKLFHHAQRNGPTARLGVVHLSLDDERLNAAPGKSFRGAGTGGPATNDSDPDLHVYRSDADPPSRNHPGTGRRTPAADEAATTHESHGLQIGTLTTHQPTQQSRHKASTLHPTGTPRPAFQHPQRRSL
mmetsp:Transcript_8532/g.25635  ORF Transcript_8532/g.25635 Transcript_8532/m.25635 type:complete len:295 (-) Transcript_8532:30-914(-)